MNDCVFLNVYEKSILKHRIEIKTWKNLRIGLLVKIVE